MIPMVSPARRLAYTLLEEIDSGRAFSDDALNCREMERIGIRDRRLVTEIVYGTIRWQGTLDYVLAKSSSRDWNAVADGAKALLRMSLYQLWRMDRTPDHAVVNDAVELAKSGIGRGTDRFVNGILRHLTRTRPWQAQDFLLESPPWVQVSLPEWLWRRWEKRFGDTVAREYALSLNRHPAIVVRAGGPDVSEMSGGTPSEIVPGAMIVGERLDNVDRGVHRQDEASQLIPHLLGVSAGWRVWDSCAAPGGKSAILTSLCGATGTVVSSDVSVVRALRMARLQQVREPSGSMIVVADARRPAPFLRPFDAVLVDVPCSGLGTVRRNPEIKWRFRPVEFPALRKTQMEILSSVAESVRVGGRLLYSTCSTEPEENEEVVNSFLAKRPSFICEAPCTPVAAKDWTGPDGMVRTFPSNRLWDGFFAAQLVRRS